MYVNSFVPFQNAWALNQGQFQSGISGAQTVMPTMAYTNPSGTAINYNFSPVGAGLQNGSFAFPASNMAWNQINPFLSQQAMASGAWGNQGLISGMINPLLSGGVTGLGSITSSVGMVQPRIELAETNNDVVVTCELPNINPNNLNLTVTDDSLSVSAIAYAGNMATSLHRTIALPTTIRAEYVDASYSNGILECRLPKSDISTRRRVKVNVVG